MKDQDGIGFLQWCLPRLHLRWPGYRKVRRQVYKRLDRRIKELGLGGITDYRSHLERHAEEWAVLDTCCRISISRFYRDKGVFRLLQQQVLPTLAGTAMRRHETDLACWSIGCGSGEEPYTISIIWKLALAPRFPALHLRVLATDIDPHALRRAREACYASSSLRDLPREWSEAAFVPRGGHYVLKEEYREPVTFREEDIRQALPPERFHVILCRNLVFTYFDGSLQHECLGKIRDRLQPGGALVLGGTEHLPEQTVGLEPWVATMPVYRDALHPVREQG